jgi:hypothetical protein
MVGVGGMVMSIARKGFTWGEPGGGRRARPTSAGHKKMLKEQGWGFQLNVIWRANDSC